MTKQELDNLTDEQISGIAEEECWHEEDVRRGYAVFSADYMSGAFHIEQLDCINAYESDSEAAIQAEKDGIKIIHDLPIDKDDYDFAYFLDTPENREIIREHLLTRGIEW